MMQTSELSAGKGRIGINTVFIHLFLIMCCFLGQIYLHYLPDAVGSCHNPVGGNEGSPTGVAPLAIGIVLKGSLESRNQVRLRLLPDHFSLLCFVPAPRTQLADGGRL